ncbi:MAG: carbamate kinase [Acidobacteriota bacterium]
MAQTAVIAVGGNSLIRAGEKGTIAEQLVNTRRTAEAIVQIIRLGFHVVVTHGNGPQVGAALLRSERSADHVYTHPLDVCDATTQGEIGYLLQQSLQGALADVGLNTPVATILTQVVVSPSDPAMERPTKPIGPFYSAREAEVRQQQFGWHIVEDAARGYRRLVPSPEPIEIIEEGVIRRLSDTGVLVVAVGGGGIPVMRVGRGLRGVEAVIDKDRASALLASQLRSDLFIISTDAERVCLNYKKPDQRPLGRVTASELAAYHAEGHFPPGNMGPKVESALRFLENGGREVIITSYERLFESVRGDAGTHVVRQDAEIVRKPATGC